MTYQLVSIATLADYCVDQTVSLLIDQWGGSFSSRRATMLQKDYSWALIESAFPNIVLGHVRLSPGVITNGNAEYAAHSGVITSVIIRPELRGQGLGAKLMDLVEVKALHMGYYTLTLWTHDSEGFYSKLGYYRCEQRRSITTMVSAFESLNHSALRGLERILAKKMDSVQETQDSPSLNPTSNAEENENTHTVWMKKRIRDEVPLQIIQASELLSTIRKTCERDFQCKYGYDILLQLVGNVQDKQTMQNEEGKELCGLGLPWSQQVGPSCGIQALRFANYMNSSDRQCVLHYRCGIEGSKEEENNLTRVVDLRFSCLSLPAQTHTEPSHITANISDIEQQQQQQQQQGEEVERKESKIHDFGPGSLLSLAVKLGYTTEGELFNIYHTTSLANYSLTSLAGSDRPEVSTISETTKPVGKATPLRSHYASVQRVTDLSCAVVCKFLIGPAVYNYISRSEKSSADLNHTRTTSTTCTTSFDSTTNISESVNATATATAGTAVDADVDAAVDADVDVDWLRMGQILFPYDRHDAKSTPCSKEGIAAHYALLCGFVILPALMANNMDLIDNSSNVSRMNALKDTSRVLLIGLHGMSRQPVVAYYDDWVASNAQLHCYCNHSSSNSSISADDDRSVHISSNHRNDSYSWKNPKSNLRDNCVLIHKNSN